MPSSQSGQFVLLHDYINKKFIFSPRNKSEKDMNSNFIIEFMNKNFEEYINVGTNGKNININQNIFSNWIINYYKTKGVKYFITKRDDYIIFPIKEYKKYFYITAKYRIKKSGSSNVPKNKWNEIIEKLNLIKLEFQELNDFKIKSNQKLEKIKFSVSNYDYIFSKLEENIYRIRKLSNTRNANVIFSINLIKENSDQDLNKI